MLIITIIAAATAAWLASDVVADWIVRRAAK